MSGRAKEEPGRKPVRQALVKGDPVARKEVGEISHDQFCETVHQQALPNEKLKDELSDLSISAAKQVLQSNSK